MKKLFIIANWKSNKTIQETEKWLHDFNDGFNKEKIKLGDKKIIIVPSFTSLEHAHYCVESLKLPVEFAAQNISPFDEGVYTGEVNGKQIKELADYVIVGHSERRRYFGEDEEMTNKKISLSYKYGLTPILCVSSLQQTQNSKLNSAMQNQNHNSKIKSYENKIIVAYEPLFAIGSGNPDTPSNADRIGEKIKEILGEIPVLYGGSVTSRNVKNFTKMPNINGVLVGGASLDPLEFLKIAQNA